MDGYRLENGFGGGGGSRNRWVKPVSYLPEKSGLE